MCNNCEEDNCIDNLMSVSPDQKVQHSNVTKRYSLNQLLFFISDQKMNTVRNNSNHTEGN